MQKNKFALSLIVCMVYFTLITVSSVSAEEELLCPPKVGELLLDWRPEYKGHIVIQSNGIRQAVCTYAYTYDNFNNPQIFVSVLVQWCVGFPCGDETSHSGHYGNDVLSKEKRAITAEEIDIPTHPKIEDAAQEIQDLRMNLLTQAEEWAVFRAGNCDDYCKKESNSGENAEHAIWDGASDYPNCGCTCEKGWTSREQGCVSCEKICAEDNMVYDPDQSSTNSCGCKCEDGYEQVYDNDLGKYICKKVTCPDNSKNVADLTGSSLPSNNRKLNRDCYCDEGYKQYWGACVDASIIDEEEAEKTPMEKERERIRTERLGLEEGHLLYAEGTVSKKYVAWAIGEADFGHVGIYIGEYEVPKGKRFKVRDPEQVPLKVFRNGKEKMLKLGEFIEEGDWIIGAVVEMRGSGAVFTTVDGMEASSRRTMGRYNVNFDWATTDPPPDAFQVKRIKDFVLSKVALTEEGKLTYWFGKQGVMGRSPLHPIDTMRNPMELWDCVSLAEAAYESGGLNPTPDYKDMYISIQPQEQYDNIGRVQRAKDRMTAAERFPGEMRTIFSKVWSPVNLHLYDSQGKHVGITSGGKFERQIPNTYLYLELEEEHQSILVQEVDDEYTLVTEAVDDGNFDLQIMDLNVRNPGSLTTIDYQDVKITKGDIGRLNIGSTDKSVSIKIDEEGDGDIDRTIEPVSIMVSPVSTEDTPEGLTFESRSRPKDSEVQIPLTLNGVQEKIGNMDITFGYDPSVLKPIEVIKGGLTIDSIFAYNILDDGTVKISLADSQGFNGDGSIAYVKFDVIGADGSFSPLQIISLDSNKADDQKPVMISTNDGIFRIIRIEENKGDNNGDGKLTPLDALSVLQMAVGKRTLDMAMDMNNDNSITSLDAKKILEIYVEN